MEATALGVMAIDGNRRITRFQEKPADPPGMPDRPQTALGSMGLYVFNADYLHQLQDEDLADPESDHGLAKNLIPRVGSEGGAPAHALNMSSVPRSTRDHPYWRDVGTVHAFWAANLDLAANMPGLNIYDSEWPVCTYQEQLPPAKFVSDETGRHGETANVLISGRCIVSGSDDREAVLFSGVRVHSSCRISQAVILPNCVIGRGSRLAKVVIDRGCRIPEGLVIGEDAQFDTERSYRTEDGVLLVTQQTLAEI